MIRNYIKIAWRSLLNNKVYSAINIGGLSLALGIGMLLIWWVQDELSYDSFHTQAKQIYRVNGSFGAGSSMTMMANIVAPVATYAKRQVPGVEEAVRIAGNYDSSPFKVGGKTLVEEKAAYVDPAFFTLFDFAWAEGSRSRPFPDLQSVVLTRKAAIRYFGTADALGKTLYSVPKKQTFVVSGVLADMPDQSSLKADLFFSFDILVRGYRANDYWKSMESDWGNWFALTFVKVSPQASLDRIARTLTELHHANNQFDKVTTYQLQPLRDIHLYSADGKPTGLQEVRMMGLVALILLTIGCINYVNLATARAAQRAREVSVRKVVGAGRRNLIAQFVAESLLIFLVALVLAVGFIKGIEPYYLDITGKTQPFDLDDPQVWAVLVGSIAFTLLIAGLYPAFVLSSFEPLKVLRGRGVIRGGGGVFRKALVITQFAFSTALIVGTIIIGNQLRFLRERNLGYDRENVFAFWITDEMRTHYQSIWNELSRTPGVRAVTGANGNLLSMGSTTGDTDWDGKGENQSFVVSPLGVDRLFLKSFGLKLVEGQGFTGSKADSTYVILNETAVRQAGIQKPIGKRFKLWQTDATIIGVVKDFHFSSLREEIRPAVLYYNRDFVNRIYVKTTGKDAPQAIAAAERLWKKYSPDYPFEYRFMDEQYNSMYKSEQRTGQLFNFFAGVAILVSCLGLLGLATFTAQQRTKEIGIRKVLGASVVGIVGLLSKDFLKLVGIAIVLAMPLSWWAMERWLTNFAYKIDIEWWVFLLAGLLAVGIALLTVSFQSVKAALRNPVKSLQVE